MDSLMSGVKACLDLFRHKRREALPPGELYRLLSAELKLRQSCSYGCSMPLPFARDEVEPGEPNWEIEGLWPQCPKCLPLARTIAAEFGLRFDMKHYASPAVRPAQALEAKTADQAAFG
jgi:hypothetical protein